MTQTTRPIIGRFAPSPTGALHLGSLTTALASFCHIKSLGGKWLLRIEDTDFERCKAEFSDQILKDLENLGLYWDDNESYQSKRLSFYEDAIAELGVLVYPCHCSRKQLSTRQPSAIYPRFCLSHQRLATADKPRLRLQLPDVAMVFYDGLQGVTWQNPQRLMGDVVIKRNNGMINYILACAVDDGLQGISHIVRGLDIIDMTSSQVFIQQRLNLPSPDNFCHLPLLINANGQKLSKQNLAKPIDSKNPSQLLYHALCLLKQNPPKELRHAPTQELLTYAVHHWQADPLLNTQSLGVID